MFFRIARGEIAPGQWPAFELAYREAIHATGKHDGLRGRWMMREMAHPNVYCGITHWDSLDTLKAYENGAARDIVAALRPFLAQEFVITYCEERYLWLAASDVLAPAPNDVLGA